MSIVCSAHGCSNPSSLQCGKCYSSYYCSKICQRVDWTAHKKLCKCPEIKDIDTVGALIRIAIKMNNSSSTIFNGVGDIFIKHGVKKKKCPTCNRSFIDCICTMDTGLDTGLDTGSGPMSRLLALIKNTSETGI